VQSSHRNKDESWLSRKWVVSITATTGALAENGRAVIVRAEDVRCYGRSSLFRPPIATEGRAVNPVSFRYWQTSVD
jgi:hypothetical protein